MQAIRNAQEKAGVFISSYSVMRDHEIEMDEVIAFTAGIVKVSNNVKYEPIALGDDLGTMKYRATVVVTIDTNDLTNQINAWLQRNSRDRSNIVEQDKDLRQLVDQQAKRIKELEQTIAATKDKEKVKQELSKLDNDTRIIEKTAEGNLAYYEGNYSAAINSYSDVLKLKEFEVEGFGIGMSSYRNKRDIYIKQAKRAATVHAQAQLYEYLCEYVERRRPGSSNDEQAKQLIDTAVRNAIITETTRLEDDVFKVKMRLRPEDVDELKKYLESNG